MKNRVIIAKENEEIKFYLKNKAGTFWLFTQPFSKGVYEWFKGGRAEGEILSFAKWNRNKRLSDTINRIPREIRYIQKYVMEVECAA
jgi:hypothetical protein